jgi:uncharacterized protein YdcH (DUF465 family)
MNDPRHFSRKRVEALMNDLNEVEQSICDLERGLCSINSFNRFKVMFLKKRRASIREELASLIGNNSPDIPA